MDARIKAVTFDEKKHKYFYNGRELHGVTGAIGKMLGKSFPDNDTVRLATMYGSDVHKEVENYFNAIEVVQDSQVFEDVLENGKHILAVEVVPRMTEIAKLGVSNVNEYVLERLKEVNENLPSYMKISKFVVRETDFERTPSMKIVRYKKCN